MMFSNAIQAVCREEYDANGINCDYTTVTWAANQVGREQGTETAARALLELNDARRKWGVYTSINGVDEAIKAAYLSLVAARSR